VSNTCVSFLIDWFVGVGSQSLQGNADGSAGTSSQGKEEASNMLLLLLTCERTWFCILFCKLDHLKC
jgi:hypothetical protein